MIAAIYSRKSKLTEKGESIENQLQLCKDYARNNLNINEFLIYEDEGYSGKNTERPEFKRMIKDSKRKKFDVLICYRLDRISRNIADFSTLIEELQELDIAFVSIREQFDTSTPMGRAMMYIASVFAQLERETTAERVKDNMMQLARTGRWLGGKTPTGYVSEPITYYDGNMNKKKMSKLTGVPEEQKIVKLLFDKYIELDGIHKLEGYCFENNIKSKNGNNFDKTALIFILTNPVYCVADEELYNYCLSEGMDIASPKSDFNGKHGLMVYNKRQHTKNKGIALKERSEWVVAVGRHKGIIPSKEWVMVQHMLEFNRNKAPRDGTSQVSLLTPLIKCGNCGTVMRIAYKFQDGKVKHHYYMCRLKERSRGLHCNIKNLNGKEAERIVIEELKQFSLNKELLEKQLDIKKKLNESTDSKKNDKKLLENKLKDTEKSIENLTMQLAANSSSTAATYIIKQIEKLDSELKELKNKIDSIDDEVEQDLMKKMSIDILMDRLVYLRENINVLEFEQKKKLIANVVSEIVYNGEKLKIILREPKI